MVEYRDSASPSQELDFEKAEFDAPSAPTCAGCQRPITDGYYTLGPQLVCPDCRLRAAESRPPGNALARVFGAVLLGTLAAAAGCGLWMVVTELTGYEIGLIAIAVGFLVGRAVHVGSRRTGGLVYQLLAVFLTYTAIVMTYVPALAQADGEELSIVGACLIAIPLAYAVPFLLGFENAIGILIIGFAVWQAWKMNASTVLDWQGPFRLEGGTGAGG